MIKEINVLKSRINENGGDFKVNPSIFTRSDGTTISEIEIIDDDVIAHCKINCNANKEFEIVSWFVNKEYQNHHMGTQLLFATFACLMIFCGEPKKVIYVWNGTNQYVYDWLEKNFNPVHVMPIALMKYENEQVPGINSFYLDRDKIVTMCKKYY